MNDLTFDTNIDEQSEFEPFYNKHFIKVNEQGCIIKGWSDAFEPATEDSIVINSEGGYQFRLYPNGEENPNLFTMDMIPLYKWDGEKVVVRTAEEIEADRETIPKYPAPPSLEERLSAVEGAMLAKLLEEAE